MRSRFCAVYAVAVALSLGLAMLGVAKEPYLARAHSFCCTFGAGECTNVAEVDCPVDPSCPDGCATYQTTYCCHINKEIACYECGCVVDCHCAYPTGNPC